MSDRVAKFVLVVGRADDGFFVEVGPAEGGDPIFDAQVPPALAEDTIVSAVRVLAFESGVPPGPGAPIGIVPRENAPNPSEYFDRLEAMLRVSHVGKDDG